MSTEKKRYKLPDRIQLTGKLNTWAADLLGIDKDRIRFGISHTGHIPTGEKSEAFHPIGVINVRMDLCFDMALLAPTHICGHTDAADFAMLLKALSAEAEKYFCSVEDEKKEEEEQLELLFSLN